MTATILPFFAPEPRCLICAKWCQEANQNFGWCLKSQEPTNSDWICEDFERKLADPAGCWRSPAEP